MEMKSAWGHSRDFATFCACRFLHRLRREKRPQNFSAKTESPAMSAMPSTATNLGHARNLRNVPGTDIELPTIFSVFRSYTLEPSSGGPHRGKSPASRTLRPREHQRPLSINMTPRSLNECWPPNGNNYRSTAVRRGSKTMSTDAPTPKFSPPRRCAMSMMMSCLPRCTR